MRDSLDYLDTKGIKLKNNTKALDDDPNKD